MAAQSLFRTSATEQKNAESLMKLAEKAPDPEPQKVIVDNPPEQPVPTTSGPSEDLPEYAR
jgi:hypothetical protein